MTALCTFSNRADADASSRHSFTWHAVNWQKAIETVRRLQVRIVKATQAGKWRKVRALQRLLTRSFSAKLLAVKRVTENQGARTAGIDGELWDTPQKKRRGVEQLAQRPYRARPLRRIYIPKTNGKKRPLGIPTMRDRAQQALHLLALDPIAETTGDANSYGFRRERSPVDAISQCFKILHRSGSAHWILEGDIKGCFDHISHDWLLEHIPLDKHILQEWLKAGYVEQSAFHLTDAGTPQGGIASPGLANMTLDGLETQLRNRYPLRSGKRVNLVRFADDFIITACSKELLEGEIVPLVEVFLQERGLQLSREKTQITHIDDGFDFLGQTIRKYKGKLLIKPSAQSRKRLLTKVRQIIKTEGRYLSAYGLIQRLNSPSFEAFFGPTITAMFVSKQTFARIDSEIFRSLWRQLMTQTSQAISLWTYKRYFVSPETDSLAYTTAIRRGRKQNRHLPLPSTTPVHPTTCQGEAKANPYDPAWEIYFEHDRTTRSQTNSGVDRSCSNSGDDNAASVPPANNASPKKLAGTCIISFPRFMAEENQRTSSSFIPTAIGKSIALITKARRCVLHRAFEVLEPYAGKLARMVL
ncbi:MAG: group II intron reverse transcriptase/maturase [Caldilineaceae bacterium]